MNDDWDALRHVLAIARGGSLAAAARALAVNHSTVFRRLNALEARLGVRLFERTPQGYVLTPAGEEVRGHAERAEAAVHAAGRSIAGGDVRLAGDVRLTTAPHLATDYVAPLLPAFRARYPGIRVELAAGDGDFDLGRREADLALRATAQPPESLVGRRVLDLPWFACASPAYLARCGRPEAPHALAGHALIGADAAFSRLAVFAWWRRQYPDDAFVARAGDLNSMAAMAAAGLGVALLPADQAHAGLERLFRLAPSFDGGLWLLLHADLRQTARVRALADFLFDALRADARLAPFVSGAHGGDAGAGVAAAR